MFDYQLPDGMIIDCIYTNSADNNARDSKPPLVCWAVDEIFTHTQDTTFVKEMYPQLLAYYKWWYANATTTVTASVSLVLPTAPWKLPHGKVVWTMPFASTTQRC